LDFKKNMSLLVAIAAIFSGLLNSFPSIDIAFATSEEDGGGEENGGRVMMEVKTVMSQIL
jgi:hypothetical protein